MCHTFMIRLNTRTVFICNLHCVVGICRQNSTSNTAVGLHSDIFYHRDEMMKTFTVASILSFSNSSKTGNGGSDPRTSKAEAFDSESVCKKALFRQTSVYGESIAFDACARDFLVTFDIIALC